MQNAQQLDMFTLSNLMDEAWTTDARGYRVSMELRKRHPHIPVPSHPAEGGKRD